jgi:small multidrug resistance pump
MLILNSWLYLLIAIIFGALGTVSMKLSEGLKRLTPSLYLLFFYSISFTALTLALRGIDIGIVYAIWSGVGTIIVAVIGIVAFKESISMHKIISLCLIVIGVIGIHLTDAIH